eukprot:1134246-Pelagomonas_calceolata.AAC.7
MSIWSSPLPASRALGMHHSLPKIHSSSHQVASRLMYKSVPLQPCWANNESNTPFKRPSACLPPNYDSPVIPSRQAMMMYIAYHARAKR